MCWSLNHAGFAGFSGAGDDARRGLFFSLRLERALGERRSRDPRLPSLDLGRSMSGSGRILGWSSIKGLFDDEEEGGGEQGRDPPPDTTKSFAAGVLWEGGPRRRAPSSPASKKKPSALPPLSQPPARAPACPRGGLLARPAV